jgi:hypothetical protein
VEKSCAETVLQPCSLPPMPKHNRLCLVPALMRSPPTILGDESTSKRCLGSIHRNFVLTSDGEPRRQSKITCFHTLKADVSPSPRVRRSRNHKAIRELTRAHAF